MKDEYVYQKMGDVMFLLCELELVDKFLLLDENWEVSYCKRGN